MKDDEMDGYVACMGEIINAHIIQIGKLEVKTTPRLRRNLRKILK
jgi:hypothetical protein